MASRWPPAPCSSYPHTVWFDRPCRLVRRRRHKWLRAVYLLGSSRRRACRFAPLVNHPLTIVAADLARSKAIWPREKGPLRDETSTAAGRGHCRRVRPRRVFRRHEPRQPADQGGPGRSAPPTPRRCWWPRTRSASARSPAAENFRWQDWPQKADQPAATSSEARGRTRSRTSRLRGARADAAGRAGHGAEAREGRRRRRAGRDPAGGHARHLDAHQGGDGGVAA